VARPIAADDWPIACSKRDLLVLKPVTSSTTLHSWSPSRLHHPSTQNDIPTAYDTSAAPIEASKRTHTANKATTPCQRGPSSPAIDSPTTSTESPPTQHKLPYRAPNDSTPSTEVNRNQRHKLERGDTQQHRHNEFSQEAHRDGCR
jgi:hypothetical protein